jgi:hypothetical protein
MSAVRAGATAAIAAVLDALDDAGITATSDAGAFYPQPVGVLVGLPTLTKRGLHSATYEVPMHVVSGDPLNDSHSVDRLYALADDCAIAVRTDNYRPSSWAGSVNAEPLPAIEMAATVTLAHTNGGN